MIQQEIKIKTFEKINQMLDLMNKINDIEVDCNRYIQSADNNKLNASFQHIREIIALNHYYQLNRLHIFKESE